MTRRLDGDKAGAISMPRSAGKGMVQINRSACQVSSAPDRPREVPLRWDPPTPWWRKWWVWGIAAGTVAAATGIAVYAAQWEPSDELPANVGVETQP